MSAKLTAWWLVMLMTLSMMIDLARAQSESKLSQGTHAALQSVQALLDKNQAKNAVTRLHPLLNAVRSKPYEHAVVLQTLGYAHLADEDYPAAIIAFKQSYDTGALPASVQQDVRYNLAQLYLATEDFPNAIEWVRAWQQFAAAPTAQSQALLGIANLQAKQFEAAVEPLKKAIALADSPQESWFQSLLAAYSELGDYTRCADVLHTMVRRFPDSPTYWQQLAGMELSRERYTDAVAVTEQAYRLGYIDTETELLNLAQLYRYVGAPYKSAMLTEREMITGRVEPSKKNVKQLANSWVQAKEYQRAIDTLERAAASDNDVDIRLQLSQLYITLHQWRDAEKPLNEILANRHLDDKVKGGAWLLLGVVLVEQGKITDARYAFDEAQASPDHRLEARQWLSFLEEIAG